MSSTPDTPTDDADPTAGTGPLYPGTALSPLACMVAKIERRVSRVQNCCFNHFPGQVLRFVSRPSNVSLCREPGPTLRSLRRRLVCQMDRLRPLLLRGTQVRGAEKGVLMAHPHLHLHPHPHLHLIPISSPSPSHPHLLSISISSLSHLHLISISSSPRC